MHDVKVIAVVPALLVSICGCSGEDLTVTLLADDSDVDQLAVEELPTPQTYALENAHAAPSAIASRGELGTLSQAITPSVYGTVTYIGNIPSNKDTAWFDHAQGVAIAPINGVINMFYSTNTVMYGREAQSSSQFGVSQNFPSGNWTWSMPGFPSTPGNYNHFGDPDFVENASGTSDLVYVTVEEDGKDFPPLLLIYSVIGPSAATLQSAKLLEDNPTNDSPWVSAWSPNPRYVATSPFNSNYVVLYYDTVSGVGFDYAAAPDIYQLTTDTFQSLSLTAIQGGEFNKNGRLFLIAENGPSGPGVYAFVFEHANAGAFAGQTVLMNFDYYPATLTPGRGEEFEGITVGTIDPPEANDLSDIHVVLNQGGSIFFKHWVVSQNWEHFAP